VRQKQEKDDLVNTQVEIKWKKELKMKTRTLVPVDRDFQRKTV